MALFKELHGQAVGGEMLVGKRVGFSGTPSPECWILMYRILRVLKDYWAVEQVSVANNRYNAFIDAGALIIGYSKKK